MEQFTPQHRRVRLQDGREGVECRAPIDSLWTINLDDGTFIYVSCLKPNPVAEYLS